MYVYCHGDHHVLIIVIFAPPSTETVWISSCQLGPMAIAPSEAETLGERTT